MKQDERPARWLERYSDSAAGSRLGIGDRRVHLKNKVLKVTPSTSRLATLNIITVRLYRCVHVGQGAWLEVYLVLSIPGIRLLAKNEELEIALRRVLRERYHISAEPFSE